MTMSNIPDVDIERLALKVTQLAGPQMRRAEEVRRLLTELDNNEASRRAEIIRGIAVLIQQSRDEANATRAVLQEEARQHEQVEELINQLTASLSQPTPAEPAQPPAAPTDNPTATQPPVVEMVPPPADRAPRRAPSWNPRDWSPVVRLIALVGALLGLVVGLLTDHYFAELPQPLLGILATLWVVVVAVLGFYLFGVIASAIFDLAEDEPPAHR